MDLLAFFTKTQLFFISFIVGIFVIVYFNQPYTVCQAEIDQFKSSHSGILYSSKTKKAKFKKKPKLTRFLKECRSSGSLGGCENYFASLSKVYATFRDISDSCYDTFSQMAVVKKTISQALGFFIIAAWGDKPPEGSYERTNWLDKRALHLFCSYLKYAKSFYGEMWWKKLFTYYYNNLPEAKTLTKNQFKKRSLFSHACY